MMEGDVPIAIAIDVINSPAQSVCRRWPQVGSLLARPVQC